MKKVDGKCFEYRGIRPMKPHLFAISRALMAVVSVGLIIGASPCFAQAEHGEEIPVIESLTPLNKYLERPDNERLPSYPFLRCGGLFLGYTFYTGANMSDENRQNTERNIANLRFVAITFSAMRSAESQGIDLEQLGAEQVRQIADQVWRQMNGIAFFYDDRMEANFASDGAAFSEDKLIIDDLSTCSDFAQTAKDLQSALQ